MKESSYYICECSVNDRMPCNINSQCINVISHIECSPDICPAKNKCENQNFLKGEQFDLEVKQTELKGLGLFTREEIPQKRFLIEYVGKVIGKEEFLRRSNDTSKAKYYIFGINTNMYIDGSIRGNNAQYINHSCKPNVTAEKWIICSNGREETRIGFFALRTILPVRCLTSIYFINFDKFVAIIFLIIYRARKLPSTMAGELRK